MVTKIYEKELSYKIIGCAIQVHKALGSGYMEKLYERALLAELAESGLKAETQVPVQVHYKNILISDYKIDIIVENKVIIELKACSKIIPGNEAQSIQYLCASGIRIGKVTNFGSSGKLEYVRKVV